MPARFAAGTAIGVTTLPEGAEVFITLSVAYVGVGAVATGDVFFCDEVSVTEIPARFAAGTAIGVTTLPEGAADAITRSVA